MTTLPVTAPCCDPCCPTQVVELVATSVSGILSVASTSAVRALAATYQVPGQAIIKQGGTSAFDGGALIYTWDSSSTAADDGVFTVKPGNVAAASPGRWRRALVQGDWPVRLWGAKLDGTTDDSAAVNTAIASLSAIGGGNLLFEGTTAKLNSRIDLASNVNLVTTVGTTLDFSGATLDERGNLYGTGTATLLPALAAGVVAGDNTILFASNHNLSIGDIIVIIDTTNGSFNPVRPVYRSGEWMTVAALPSSTQITLGNRTFAAYNTGAARKVYKVTPLRLSISGFRMRFRQGDQFAGIRLTLASDCQLSHLDLSGSIFTQIELDRCYKFTLTAVKAYDYQADVGLNYGVHISNSQRITIANCQFETCRHGVSFGGLDTDQSVVNRELVILGGTISGYQATPAVSLNFHGNCEWYTVSGCQIPTGIELGGDHGRVTGCTIGNGNNLGYAVVGGEIIGASFEIDSNTIYATRTFTEGMVSFTLRAALTRPNGSYHFTGNKVFCGPYAHPTPGSDTRILYVLAQADTAIDDLAFHIEGNTFSTDHVPSSDPIYAIAVVPLAAKGIRRIDIANNQCLRCGLYTKFNFRTCSIRGNKVWAATYKGIFVDQLAAPSITRQVLDLCGNSVEQCNSTGIFLIPATAALAVVNCHSNTSLNNAQIPAASTVDSSIYITGALVAIIEQNVVGDNQAAPTQLYTYVADAITTLYHRINYKIGITPIVATSITNDMGVGDGAVMFSDLTYGPRTNVNKFHWNIATPSLGIGGPASGLATQPLNTRHDFNGLVQNIARNSIAAGAGNTAAAVAWAVESTTSSGIWAAFPSDYADINLADCIALLANSTAAHLVLHAAAAGQTIKFFAGGGVESARFDAAAGAGETRMRLWDVDNGALERVTVGAADSGGIGFKVLRIPN